MHSRARYLFHRSGRRFAMRTAAAERRTDLVRYGDVQIEVVAEGEGPAVVLLPSLARDSDDYDRSGGRALGCRVSCLAAEAARYRP